MGHNSRFWDLAGQDVEDVVCLRACKKDTRASQLGGDGGVVWQVALLLMKTCCAFRLS
jgi:hypothetical protein